MLLGITHCVVILLGDWYCTVGAPPSWTLQRIEWRPEVCSGKNHLAGGPEKTRNPGTTSRLSLENITRMLQIYKSCQWLPITTVFCACVVHVHIYIHLCVSHYLHSPFDWPSLVIPFSFVLGAVPVLRLFKLGSSGMVKKNLSPKLNRSKFIPLLKVLARFTSEV